MSTMGPLCPEQLTLEETLEEVCVGPKHEVAAIGIGGASRLRPSHTTVRTGPYTAVREVALTRLEQGWQAERFEVGI
jgi:hypothetical protein